MLELASDFFSKIFSIFIFPQAVARWTRLLACFLRTVTNVQEKNYRWYHQAVNYVYTV